MAMRMGTAGTAVALWALCCCFMSPPCVGAAEAGPESAASYPSPMQKQGPCNYTILVETSCAEGAGTSGGRVSLRFGDATSTDVVVHPLRARRTRTVDGARPAVLDDAHRRPFQACSADAFEASGDCVLSRVCYLYLKHQGAQEGEDRWRPSRVQVLVQADARRSSGTFYFRRFLPRQVWHGFDVCEARMTPFGARRTRKAFAGGRRGRPST